MKEQFRKFTNENYIASKILYSNGKYHIATYLGGYVLEGYLKMLLISAGISSKNIKTHNYKRLLSIFPSAFANINITNINNLTLVCGDTGFPRWHPEKRYNVTVWNNQQFSKKIQNDIETIKNEMDDLRLKGLL